MFESLKTFIIYKICTNVYTSKDVLDDALFAKDTNTLIDFCALVIVHCSTRSVNFSCEAVSTGQTNQTSAPENFSDAQSLTACSIDIDEHVQSLCEHSIRPRHLKVCPNTASKIIESLA